MLTHYSYASTPESLVQGISIFLAPDATKVLNTMRIVRAELHRRRSIDSRHTATRGFRVVVAEVLLWRAGARRKR